MQRYIHMLASLHSLPGSSFAVCAMAPASSYQSLDSSIPTHELDVSVRSKEQTCD